MSSPYNEDKNQPSEQAQDLEYQMKFSGASAGEDSECKHNEADLRDALEKLQNTLDHYRNDSSWHPIQNDGTNLTDPDEYLNILREHTLEYEDWVPHANNQIRHTVQQIASSPLPEMPGEIAEKFEDFFRDVIEMSSDPEETIGEEIQGSSGGPMDMEQPTRSIQRLPASLNDVGLRLKQNFGKASNVEKKVSPLVLES
ncbi:hypothetical protein BS50DRAFT_681810 [Corynespora cassiicola Philippines]|uniref:Uncharacterized protein n=1 Tax=Corynespora cassiicola Philippines TaxID=1448308 RepID=A0A2T2N3G5_CORCC|nr:hypothetical protein BS50DRAFT_681810 [Corynespora cassiicola Philippines]